MKVFVILLVSLLGCSATDCDVCAQDKEEYCSLFPSAALCASPCGFEFDASKGLCTAATPTTTTPLVGAADSATAAPIIGGSGKYRYQYMPGLLQPPAGAALVNCHGLSVDKDENIILTYQNDGKDPHCLIKWNPDGTNGTFASEDTRELCSGTPHGLKITTESTAASEGDERGTEQQFLYHANNNQKLAKTTLDGEIVWIKQGPFGQDMTCGADMCPAKSCRCKGGQAPYIPTWFATPPNSKYIYLCDGYGSDRVFAFDSSTGEFANKTWGGRSPAGLHPGVEAARAAPHGKFMENHGCTYDPRPTTASNTIVVSDRRNMRFELFHYNPEAPDTFEWYKTVDMSPSLGNGTLPCNMRMNHGSKFDPSKGGVSIVPDLNGPVAVLDSKHDVLSVVNVSVLLAAEEHKHPHDALFLANGDMVVGTWAPGRISYWKLLPVD